MEDGDVDVLRVPGPESFEVDGKVYEFVTEVEVESDLLRMGRGGGAFSLSADDGTLILGILVLREPAEEGRFRRLFFPFRLGPVLTVFESLLESIPELDSDFLVSPLSRLIAD